MRPEKREPSFERDLTGCVINDFPFVNRTPLSLPRLIVCLVAAVGLAAVGGRAEEVEVTSAKFSNVRAPNGAPGTWLEADLAIEARPAASSIGRMVGHVRVALTLGFELAAPTSGGERRLEFYHAEAECVALEQGRADVRFYLPPEVVKRDQLHGDPKYWGVELMVGGKAVPAGKSAYAITLPGADTRKNFQNRANGASAANDGILLPQYLSPFANEYPRATPSFVRHETR